MIKTFRQRLLNHEPMVGTFLKTPSSILCEVLGQTPLAAICLDAEHAPFGRMELDSCIFALRAFDMPSLVRVPSATPAEILNALDCGATGIVLPHICSAEQAQAAAQAAHYGRGGRGYAGSSRAAGYTTKPMARHKEDSLKETTVIAQIEDIEAVEAIDEIAKVEDIDCLFVGRIDLTVALDADSPDAPEVLEAVEKICAAGKAAGKPVGMFLPKVSDAGYWQSKGASFFLLSSDHSFLLQGANTLVETFQAQSS